MGIGCGLVLNGRLYTGARGGAGEIGHIKVMENGPGCKCGKSGCLQAVASGPALLRRSWELAANEGAELPVELSEVVCLADEGVGWAAAAFCEGAGYLAGMISFLVMALDIPLVILGGGVIKTGDVFLKPLREALERELLNTSKTVEIRISELVDVNGVLGALHLARTMYHKAQIKD